MRHLDRSVIKEDNRKRKLREEAERIAQEEKLILEIQEEKPKHFDWRADFNY